MTLPPRILVLDDGDLCDAADALDTLGLAYTHLRGGEIEGRLPAPLDLLVTTPRRAECVRKEPHPEADAGRPVRIVAVDGDSLAMRDQLRRLGFHMLVRRPTHPQVWRLVLQRALYQGNERRHSARLPMGSQVSVRADGSAQGAVLVDLSNRGCRLHSDCEFRAGSRLALEIPADVMGGEPLRLAGTLVRVASEAPLRRPVTHSAALLFDCELLDETRRRLADLLNRLSQGPGSRSAADKGLPLPPVESPDLAGLCLDDETDPSVTANVPVALSADPAGPADFAGTAESETLAAERRRHSRGPFTERVVASGPHESLVLMGRDLSTGGMRVERLPELAVGDHFRLAIYGSDHEAPLEVRACVLRDDGEDGLALGFEDVSRSLANELEKIVACLPDVESLEQGELDVLGSVLSEVLPADRREES